MEKRRCYPVKWIALLTFGLALSCASQKPEQKKKQDYFTSGSAEADKRAEREVPADIKRPDKESYPRSAQYKRPRKKQIPININL